MVCAFHALKVHLHYGENGAKLVGFKEHTKYFYYYKTYNLARFSALCKHHFDKLLNFCHHNEALSPTRWQYQSQV
jgi:hypothetical protein